MSRGASLPRENDSADVEITAMKNADSMVKTILSEVDSNGDGKIQYQGTHDPDIRKHPHQN